MSHVHVSIIILGALLIAMSYVLLERSAWSTSALQSWLQETPGPVTTRDQPTQHLFAGPESHNGDTGVRNSLKNSAIDLINSENALRNSELALKNSETAVRNDENGASTSEIGARNSARFHYGTSNRIRKGMSNWNCSEAPQPPVTQITLHANGTNTTRRFKPVEDLLCKV
jgi:hypothetical protein